MVNTVKHATKQPHPNALTAVAAFAIFFAYLNPQAPAIAAIKVPQAISVAIPDNSKGGCLLRAKWNVGVATKNAIIKVQLKHLVLIDIQSLSLCHDLS